MAKYSQDLRNAALPFHNDYVLVYENDSGGGYYVARFNSLQNACAVGLTELYTWSTGIVYIGLCKPNIDMPELVVRFAAVCYPEAYYIDSEWVSRYETAEWWNTLMSPCYIGE